jgi:hypothetical protein
MVEPRCAGRTPQAGTADSLRFQGVSAGLGSETGLLPKRLTPLLEKAQSTTQISATDKLISDAAVAECWRARPMSLPTRSVDDYRVQVNAPLPGPALTGGWVGAPGSRGGG